MRKYGLIFSFLMVSFSLQAAVNDMVTTGSKVVAEIRVSKDGLIYLVSEDGNWSAPGCPNASYVYLDQSLPISDKIYSTALASKISNEPVVLSGLCGDDNGNDSYIRFEYMVF